MSPGAVIGEGRPRRRIARPVGVLVAALIVIGGLAGAIGMGLGSIAAGADTTHPGYVHYGHHEHDTVGAHRRGHTLVMLAMISTTPATNARTATHAAMRPTHLVDDGLRLRMSNAGDGFPVVPLDTGIASPPG